VQCAALVVGEVVAFVVGDEFDHGTLGQRGRLIENEPSVLDPGSKGSCNYSTTSTEGQQGRQLAAPIERGMGPDSG